MSNVPALESDLAREHFTRAHGAFEAWDLVVGVTFLYLAAEAAIVALSELNGTATERPLARDEVSGQVLELGYFDLAAPLDWLIHVRHAATSCTPAWRLARNS